MSPDPGKLYLVPTPIGNLEDISSRAARVLEEVELVACEDTRNSGRLLKHLGLKKTLISYHEFNETNRAAQLVERIEAGASVAVITDSGSPGISDPAYRVVRAAVDNGIEIIALPGPCAIIPALTASGLPTDRFSFEGFLPPKSGARRRRLEELAEMRHTLVFYESPHRVAKLLADVQAVLGNRPACLSREISKKFEEHIRGSVSEIIARLEQRPAKGELVLVVGGVSRKSKDSERDAD